jgi:hypothetical protein
MTEQADNKLTQKGILEFDLEDPEAKNDFEICLKANKMAATIWDIDNICRNYLKWNETATEETTKLLEEIRDECAQYLELIN